MSEIVNETVAVIKTVIVIAIMIEIVIGTTIVAEITLGIKTETMIKVVIVHPKGNPKGTGTVDGSVTNATKQHSGNGPSERNGYRLPRADGSGLPMEPGPPTPTLPKGTKEQTGSTFSLHSSLEQSLRFSSTT